VDKKEEGVDISVFGEHLWQIFTDFLLFLVFLQHSCLL
jgi:hypothetical protein